MWDLLFAALPYAGGFFFLIGVIFIILKIADFKRLGRKKVGNDGSTDDK